MDDRNASPINALPPVVTALALGIGGVELVLTLAERGLLGGARSVGWRLAAIEDYGVFQAVLDAMATRQVLPPEHALRLVAYPFVHYGVAHAAMATVFVLAMGKFVGEVFAGWAVAAVFFGSAVIGALVWWAVVDDPVPLVGAYPGAYGLIGAFTFLLWADLAGRAQGRAKAFRLIGVLVAIQLIFFGLFGGGLSFVADMGGFAAGFGLSFLLVPGGWARAMARMRRR